MDLTEQVKTYHQLEQEINRLQEQKKALGALIMNQMDSKKLQVADYFVQRYSRLSIKLSIEEARTFEAVKMQETVDRKKVKSLYQEGKIQSGVSEISYLRITQSSA